MEIKTGHTEDRQTEEYITQRLWQHNNHFGDVNINPLNVILYDDEQQIMGGLLAHT